MKRLLVSAIVALSVLVVPVAGSAGPSAVDVSPADPYAACPAVVQAQSSGRAFEPQVAIAPRSIGTDHEQLVGVWQQDRIAAGSAGIVGATSADSGRTWQESPLPFTRCAPNGLSTGGSSDPWVSIGPDGTVYASALGLDAKPNGDLVFKGVLVAASHDGGHTWSDAQAIPGTVGVPEDKDSITADPTKPRVAYAVWATSPPSDTWAKRVAFSETRDGGKTWSKPHVIPLGGAGVIAVNDHQILVDPRTHALYDIFFRYEHTPARRVCKTVKGKKTCRLVKPGPHSADLLRYVVSVITSHDGGSHWTTPRSIGVANFGFLGPQGRGHLGWPSSAIDPKTGILYSAWEDERSGEITFSRSTDGGKAWSKLRSLPTPGGSMTLPAIAVDRAGNVGLTYETVLTPAQGMATTVWLTVSHDHGLHFGQPTTVGGPSNLVPLESSGQTAAKAPFLGDYEALTAGNAFYPFFVLTNGDSNFFHTDVFAATMTATQSSRADN